MDEGRHDDVVRMAQALQACGRRFGEPNLIALGVMAEGLAHLMQGETSQGMALLDDAMLSATTEDLDPGWAGNIYCHLMVACFEIGDLRRAAEWTHATMAWCGSLAAPGPFLGICRAHRAQVFTMQGDLEGARRDALAVCESASPFDLGSVAEAHYALGEIARLRGDLAAAREAFAAARAGGRDPQPGYALLLLAQGRAEEAATSIATAIAGRLPDAVVQLRLHAAQAEIALARNDPQVARESTGVVETLANRYPGDANLAIAHAVAGSVALAEGRYSEALSLLRESFRRWQLVNVPIESALVRLKIAEASAALGDRETAAAETAAARAALDRLGLPAALEDRHARLAARVLPGGITDREAQVLALLAGGLTNREIGASLFISPRTVARHLENIYAKLSVSTRSAAAAWAAAHDLQRVSDGVNDPLALPSEWVN